MKLNHLQVEQEHLLGEIIVVRPEATQTTHANPVA
jgi:hypothetical protein